MTLAELAIHIPASIEMFEKYNFNYYQNGSQKFKDACEEKGLIFSEIDAELNQLQKLSKNIHTICFFLFFSFDEKSIAR